MDAVNAFDCAANGCHSRSLLTYPSTCTPPTPSYSFTFTPPPLFVFSLLFSFSNIRLFFPFIISITLRLLWVFSWTQGLHQNGGGWSGTSCSEDACAACCNGPSVADRCLSERQPLQGAEGPPPLMAHLVILCTWWLLSLVL